MFSTVIEFAKNPEIVNPEFVDASTYDPLGIAIFALLILAVASGLFFAYKQNVFAAIATKGLMLKQTRRIDSKKLFVTIAFLLVAIAGLFIFSSSKLANADNSLDVTTTDKVIGVVDEVSGKVAIEQAIVTNEGDEDLEFNAIVLDLFPGINDGQCNWKISIAKNDEEDAEVVFDDVANNHNIFYEPWQFEKGQKYTVTFEVTMDPAVAKSLEGQQIATLTYDITEPQERVNATINFNEKSITPAGKKVIEKNGWIESPGNGTYQAKKVKNSEIAPELVPFEQSMSDGDIFKTYMKFSSWTITEDLEKFTKAVSISANWADRDGLRGYIVDGSGKPVEGAKVVAYDKDTGQKIAELITDENGKYIFEFPPLETDKDYVVTGGKDATPGSPSLVIPSKEFHSYEPGGELGTSTANDNSSLKGHVNGLPSSPTTWAVFHADDGNDYYAPVDKNGNYNLPVPADTPGNLFFENSGPSVNIEGFPNIDTPSKGGSSQLPESGVMPKENMATVKYTLNPSTEGARLIVTQYDPNTQTEHSYSATTDKDGKVTLPVWPGMNGDVEISFYDPFTKQNVSYAESFDALEIGETYDKPIDVKNVFTVTLNLGDVEAVATHVPRGWIADPPIFYKKYFVGGSDLATISNQWKIDYITPPGGKIFCGFYNNCGILDHDANIRIEWADAGSQICKISGKVTNSSGEAVRGIKIYMKGPDPYFYVELVTATDHKGQYNINIAMDEGLYGTYFINAGGYNGKYSDFVSKTEEFVVNDQAIEHKKDLVINPCTYIVGNLQFSGYASVTNIVFKDTNNNVYRPDLQQMNYYSLRVPPNTQGTITGKLVFGTYPDRSYTVTSGDVGEQVTRDFYFYKTGYKLTCNFDAGHTDQLTLIYASPDEQYYVTEFITEGQDTYELTVPPKSEGLLWVRNADGKDFKYNLTAGNEGATGSLDISFASFPKLTVTITNGTFDADKLLDHWTLEGNTKVSTTQFTKGSQIDACLEEVEDAIVPNHNFYFKYFDTSALGEILQTDSEVNVVCGSYIYGPEKFYQDGAEAGSIQILGEMTEAAKGLRIVPFASSVLLYDSNDQLQTIISAVYNDTKFWSLAPTSWSFNDAATEESGYIQSQICATPTSSYPAETFNLNIDSGGLFSADDIAKLQKVFHKDSNTSWSMRFTNQYPAESWLVRDVMNFLNIVPVREGFEFAGWYIPEVIKGDNPVLARWVPVSEANGITRENIIVPVDNEGYQEALAALQSNEDSE